MTKGLLLPGGDPAFCQPRDMLMSFALQPRLVRIRHGVSMGTLVALSYI